MREILKLTPEQGRDIVYEATNDFQEVRRKIIDHTDWSIVYSLVVQRKSDGKYFETQYSVGATEHQDEAPYNYASEALFEEVKPIEQTTIVYKWIE